MTETPTDVLVAGYQDIDEATRDFESLVALVSDEADLDRGRHPGDARPRWKRLGAPDGRPPRSQGVGVGRRGRGRGGSVRAAAAGVGGRRGGRGRGDRQVRRPPSRARHPRQDRREPAAGIGRDHRDLRRRAAPRCRAGAPGRAAALSRPGRQAGHRRPEGVARRGDGEVQSGPHRAADPRSELRRHGRAHARRVGRRLDDQHDAVAAGGRAERPARLDRRRGLRQPVDVWRPCLDART